MRRLLFAVAMCLFAAPAYAQTGIPTSYTLKIYQAGAPTAVGVPVVVQASQVQCGQPRVAGANVNPTTWRWNDGATTNDCVLQDATRLAALPDGSYEGTVTASNASGSSAESARAPFTRSRPNPPAAPTGVRITD